MKTSMKERVLERLIAEVTKPIGMLQAKVDSQALAYARLAAERDRLAQLAQEAGRAEVPLRKLFEAAERVTKARSTGERGKATAELRGAMAVAQEYINFIPF